MSTENQDKTVTDPAAQAAASQSTETQTVVEQVSSQTSSEADTSSTAATSTAASDTPPATIEEPAQEEEFELTLSEDSPLSEAEFDEFIKFVEEKKLSKETAEELLKERETYYKKGSDVVEARYREQAKKDYEAIKAIPEFSEEHKEATLNSINAALYQVGDKELVEALKGSLGNSIPFTRFLKRIGDMILEQDPLVIEKIRGVGAGGEAKQKSGLELLYPEYFKESKK